MGCDPHGAQRELEPKAHSGLQGMLLPGPKGRRGWKLGWTSSRVGVSKSEPTASAELSSTCPFRPQGGQVGERVELLSKVRRIQMERLFGLLLLLLLLELLLMILGFNNSDTQGRCPLA